MEKKYKFLNIYQSNKLETIKKEIHQTFSLTLQTSKTRMLNFNKMNQ